MENEDSKTRFSGRADDYAKYRPHYPEDVAHAMIQEYNLEAWSIVADIGCGTGISSEPFLKAGCRVIGVEPNAEMRAAAVHCFQYEKNFKAIEGSAEDTEIETGSIDLYLAGQAFHWFKKEEARHEALRILKPPYRALLMWNDRRPTASAFMEEYCVFLEKRRGLSGSPRRADPDGSDYDAFFGAGCWKKKSFTHGCELGIDDLIGGLFSASYSPRRNDAESQRLVDEVRTVFSRNEAGGRVRMEYETSVYYGRLFTEK